MVRLDHLVQPVYLGNPDYLEQRVEMAGPVLPDLRASRVTKVTSVLPDLPAHPA